MVNPLQFFFFKRQWCNLTCKFESSSWSIAASVATEHCYCSVLSLSLFRCSNNKLLSCIFQLIHLTWSPGIKSKQTLADDERSVSVVLSLKLYGSPWSQAVYNSGKATIQARLIILELTRMLAAHKWRFAINVNFNGATDSFFYQWAPALEHNEEHCAVILSRYDRMRLLQVHITQFKHLIISNFEPQKVSLKRVSALTCP